MPTSIRETNIAALLAELAVMALIDEAMLTPTLTAAKRGASETLLSGSLATVLGQRTFAKVETQLTELNASPGGSADVLAATLRICKN